MSTSHLDLQVVVYGFLVGDPSPLEDPDDDHQRKLEIGLRPRFPNGDIAEDEGRFLDWSRGFIDTLFVDYKHSQRWRCEFCGIYS